MALRIWQRGFQLKKFQFSIFSNCVYYRSIVLKQSGAFFPQPKQIPLGLIRVIITVIPGLLVGASISKTIANFLEENDLFVPSDEDEED